MTHMVLPNSWNQSKIIKVAVFHSLICRLMSVQVTDNNYNIEVLTVKLITKNSNDH